MPDHKLFAELIADVMADYAARRITWDEYKQRSGALWACGLPAYQRAAQAAR